jgi:uncharacterized damage-inducible protein DinB
MNRTKQNANRFREVILSGTWVANTNFQDQISSLTWEQATTRVGSLNTIAALTFHINYYIEGVLKVFEGGSLDIKDKYSFKVPPIESQKDWETLMNNMWSNSEKFAQLVELMPDSKLDEIFVDEKYGTYQRNIDGMIEHSYYHLGQVSLIKKMIISTGTK